MSDFARRDGGLLARWSVTPRIRRAGILVGAVVLLAGAGVLVRAAEAQPRTVVTTMRLPALPDAPSVDAAGCPTEHRCVVTAQIRPAQLAAVQDRFPAARVLSASQTVDAASHHVFRTLLVVRLAAGDCLFVWSQSVPGARTPADATERSIRTRHGFGQETLVVSQHETARHGVGGGRSVTVERDTTGPVVDTEHSLAGLAHDARLVLP